MRIISQDGTFDMPYEQVALRRFRRTIYLANANLCGVEYFEEDPAIAVYSTEEKAEKAMEMCRNAYENMKHNEALHAIARHVFQLPKDEEV